MTSIPDSAGIWVPTVRATCRDGSDWHPERPLWVEPVNPETRDVASDGSPVDVYRALSCEPDLSRLRSILPQGASILDLGCGSGRLSNPLAAAGHHVVAVDDSAEMLAWVEGAETVLGDVFALDLRRRFHAVLALSHLINGHERWMRSQLLRVCRKHVDDDGVVIVQPYRPGWVPTETTSSAGRVGVHLHDVVDLDGGFGAAVTYTLGERSWTQRFSAAIVDDEEMAALAAMNDLSVIGAVDGDDAWVLLEPARSRSV